MSLHLCGPRRVGIHFLLEVRVVGNCCLHEVGREIQRRCCLVNAIGSHDRHHLPDKDPCSDQERLPAAGGTPSKCDEGMLLGAERLGKESLDKGVAGLIRCTRSSVEEIAGCLRQAKGALDGVHGTTVSLWDAKQPVVTLEATYRRVAACLTTVA